MMNWIRCIKWQWVWLIRLCHLCTKHIFIYLYRLDTKEKKTIYTKFDISSKLDNKKMFYAQAYLGTVMALKLLYIFLIIFKSLFRSLIMYINLNHISSY